MNFARSLLLLCLAAGAFSAPLPSFDYASLDSSSSDLLASLLQHGGVVIDHVPQFARERLNMIENPLSYQKSDALSSLEFEEKTGLQRLTVSSGVRDGIRSNEGPMAQLSPLRDSVDKAVNKFLASLASATPTSLARVTYHNGLVRSVAAIGQGEGIEQYHHYTKRDAEQQPSTSTIMDLHVDAGCFIAMTVGGSSSSPVNDPFLLSLRSSDGTDVPAAVAPDSLIILLGAGMQNYLTTSLPLTGVPHSLSIRSFETFEDRSWYGRMYFPPADSVTQNGTVFSTAFKELAQNEGLAKNGMLGASDSVCSENHIYCWTQCMPVPADLDCDAKAALCYDTDANSVYTYPNSKDTMCMNCELVCPQTVNGVEASISNSVDDFCYPSGVNMFMDGFTSVFAGGNQCLVFFFQAATMDTWWKFLFGLVGFFVAAVFVEFLGLMRRSTFQKYQDACPMKAPYYKAALVGLHILQAFVGYIVMLGAMTYSVEVFLFVLAGLGLGYFLFNSDQPISGKAEPCCPDEYNQINS